MNANQQFRELVQKARAGDRKSVANLMKGYEPQVLAMARSLLGTELNPYADADDVTQSVHQSFLLALGNENYQFATPQELLGLVLTMARRKVAGIWRKVKRQKRFSDPQTQLVLCSLAHHVDPARIVEANDEVCAVAAKLSMIERKIFTMRLQGFNSSEMSSALGMKSVSVRVCWSRAKQRLASDSYPNSQPSSQTR